MRPTYSDSDLAYRFLCIPARRPTRTVAGSRRALSGVCSAADITLARPARARLPAGIVRRQLAARARLDQYGWGRAGYSHIGGFLAGLLAFAAFDLIPISTGGSPNEGMDAPPPAINLDTIAGCALLAVPRRSSAALRVRCECGARGDTCAWRPSSCTDCVDLSVLFHAAVRSEARDAAGRLRVAATAFRPIVVCAM